MDSVEAPKPQPQYGTEYGKALGESTDERTERIYAGVSTLLPAARYRDYPVHWFWLFVQWLTGYGKFVHAYLGFDENGRRHIYHSTKLRSQVMLRDSFLLGRCIYAEWALPVTPSVHRAFADSCHADSGLVPYGHLQNITTGAIKLWNQVFAKRIKLINKWLGEKLTIHKNPFGSGDRKQNCSERAGRKLADFIVGGQFLKIDPDLYAPDNFFQEVTAYALADPAVVQTIQPPSFS